MKRCKECFDVQIPAKLLAERCRQIGTEHDPAQPQKIVLVLTCEHGGTHRHSVYRGGHDWPWVSSLPRLAEPPGVAAA